MLMSRGSDDDGGGGKENHKHLSADEILKKTRSLVWPLNPPTGFHGSRAILLRCRQ